MAKGSTRKTGTKVSARKVSVSTKGKSHQTPKTTGGGGKGATKIGRTS